MSVLSGLVQSLEFLKNVLKQPPPQALCFSQGRGERLVMSRKGPWEGYKRPVVSFPPSFAHERET